MDGLGQDKLVLATEILKIPLTRIINSSIENGEFPAEWKEALITPILKKGDREKKENYRPVSCLAVASKVLEKVVCNQITRFMEVHGLLPDNQHGFREKRSTMTALSEMQRDWASNTDRKEKTGILLWDLSAAYDILYANLLCQKLAIYGFSDVSCRWMKTYLTGRTQKVKVGSATSKPKNLESGVPQGGILSPIIFIIYGADFDKWLNHATAFAYADDSTTSVSDKDYEEIRKKLQEDAVNVMQFMASNGLVANPSKTVFMVLGDRSANGNKHENEVMKVGKEEVKASKTANILGVYIDRNQKWSTHLHKLITALDRRLFQIRRMASKISSKGLKKISDSIWTSKLRYGLQLCTEVRTDETQSKHTELLNVQKAQNRLLRILTNTRRGDHTRIADMLKETGNLSVNQTAAQIKLLEMWKATHLPKYPIKLEIVRQENGRTQTRSNNDTKIKELGHTNIMRQSFVGDSARLWNRAPTGIKNAKTISGAKLEIKKYVTSLPL